MSHQPARLEPEGRRVGTVGVGSAFGSFGELLQGVLPDGRDFLVTLPIEAKTTATFRYSPAMPGIRTRPAGKQKSRQVARLAMKAAGRSGGGELEVVSELPEGKGLASSSADLVATVRAVAAALGVSFDEPVIESLLRHIEPSDGVMYDGVVAFHHREVRLHSRLGTLPPLAIIGHDEGGTVDTISHNRMPKPYSAADRREYGRLLAALGAAIGASDLAEVGRAATRSAVMNSKLWPTRHLGPLREVCADIGGLGLVLAHSGTMLGVLLPGDDRELSAKADHVRTACAQLGGDVTVHRTLPARREGGG